MGIIGLSVLISLVPIGVLVFLLYRFRTLQRTLDEQKQLAERRAYEIAILKELSDRIGYSLDVHQTVDIIMGSLHQLVGYSAVAYMLVEPDKLLFKVDLETSVHRKFVDRLQHRMQESLAALLNDETVLEQDVETVMVGAILVDDFETNFQSIFNIPIAIDNQVFGVLTVAHIDPDRYHEDEMTLLYKVTNQASHAVSRLKTVVDREKKKLSAMVASMSDGVLMLDGDYRIVVANPAARRIIGKSEHEQIRIFDYIEVLAGKFDIRGRLEESVEHREIVTSERIRVDDAFFVVTILPVFNERNDILGSVVVFHNVTDDVEIERLRNDFTSMLVHELRTPLDGIKSIIEVLRTPETQIGDEKRGEYLAMMYQSSVQMLSLVNDILDAAKVDSGKFVIHPESTPIREVVENVVNFYGTAARDVGVNLVANVCDRVPNEVMVDARGVGQIYNNLVSNALKFSGDNDTVTVFACRHEADGDINAEIGERGIHLPAPFTDFDYKRSGAIVGVTDTGIGIPQDELGVLFDRYRQASTARRQSGKKGTGLGLAIVKGIAEAHEGSVHVTSQEGEGTAFIVFIPDTN